MNTLYPFFVKKPLSGFISKFYFALLILAFAIIPALSQPCSPISSFSCPAVVKTLPVTLNFSGTEGGLKDKSGATTGFTMVDEPSAPLVTPAYANIPGSEPSKLQISAGKLIITTTAGISYLNPAQSAKTNSQVNALGVGFVAPSKFTIQTTLVQPNAGTGKSEQAGLRFGLDEDNYVKLVVVSTGGGASKIEMRKEIAAMSSGTDAIVSSSKVLSSSVVNLKVVVNKVASTIEGFYGLNGATQVTLGTLNIPQSIIAGKTLSDGVTRNITFAGIFATHRNAAAPLTFSFEDFKVKKETTIPDFDSINWNTASSQQYSVIEAQAKVVNGKLYSFGGLDSRKSCCTPTKRSYVYDPVADTWSKIADLPHTPNGVNFGGVTHAGIATNGTDIFIAGGYTSSVSGTGQIFGTNQVWKYIVSQNSYVKLPDLPVTIAAGQLEYFNNKLHHIGGTNLSRTKDLGDHYVLDLNNMGAGWKTMASLPNPRHHGGSEVYAGKILYFIGGQHAHNAASVTQKDVHVFDPVTNSWTKAADLPVPAGTTVRGHISSLVVVTGERILVLGGETKDRSHTNLVSAYSPAANTWKNLTPLPKNRHSGIAGTMIGNIYYSGGSASSTTYKGVPVYSTGGSAGVYSSTLCSPVSTFSCPTVVKTLPLTINFIGTEGGLKDKSGAATGFTMVDKPSAPLVTPTYANIPGYEPSKLQISAGKLIITTTAGISHLNPAQSAKTNSQVNALGVGFVAPSTFTIQTTLVQPNAGAGKSEQAGLWFGLDEDNYLKLTVVSAGGGASKIEMRKEVAAMSSSTDSKGSASMVLSSSVVNLKVVVNKVANTIEGFYRINSSTEVSLGTLTIPSSFTAGKTLSDRVTGNITFAGIFATHRNAASPLTFSFENFTVAEMINAQFVKISLPNTVGKHSTLKIGPDGKLYALTIDGIIKRFSINSDGTLATPQLLYSLQDAYGTRKKRLAIGFAFDPAATAANLVAWVTHSSYVFSNGPDWDVKLTKLSGNNLQTVQDVLINLPRSVKDHLTNSIAFGPDGALYFSQGDNSNMGRADSTWGYRPESLLSAAILRLDPSKLSTLPLNVKTREGEGTYNPYLSTSALTIYASGIRNAYDLLWHSNGQLYVPTNGASLGGNTPASVNGTLRPDGTTYNGPSIPALTNVQQTQKDFLFRVKKGGYYGHPNPSRGEYVQNGGNPTASTDPAQVNAYPVGTLSDANWKGYSFDFQDHKSPNGIIEYKSSAFNGALKGKLLVVRYANNNDIITLTPGGTSKDIISSTEGISIPGFTGFSDPLDIIEHVQTGNIYVSEYGGDGKITLLKPKTIVTISNKPPFVSEKETPGSENDFEKTKVYPNPLRKTFNIELPHTYTGNYTLQIVDQFGRVYDLGKARSKPGGFNIAIDISNLSLRPRVYLLRILSDTRKTEVIKLVIF